MVVVTNVIDKEGLPISIFIQPNGRVFINNSRKNSVHAVSIYAKDDTYNFIMKAFENDNILRVYKNKATELEKVLGNQFPNKFFNSDFIYIISNSNEIVKKSLDVDSDGNKLTAEQQEYFANSKIRDESGRLLVVYHGTPNEFTVFDNRAVSYSNQGHYFTDNKEYAVGYSQRTRKVLKGYINITKPFDIRDKDVRNIFINEYVKGGYAQGISPYSTDAQINAYIKKRSLPPLRTYKMSMPIRPKRKGGQTSNNNITDSTEKFKKSLDVDVKCRSANSDIFYDIILFKLCGFVGNAE